MSSATLWPIAGAAALGLGRAAARAVGDGVSFAAELLRADEPTQADPSTAEGASSSGWLQDFQRRVDLLARQIEEKLRAAGVCLDAPLTLVSDGLAGLAIAGDHPQRAAIEEALSSDVLLERDFDRLARNCSELTGRDLQLEVGRPFRADETAWKGRPTCLAG